MFIYFSYNDYTYMNSTSGLYFGIVAESACLIKVVRDTMRYMYQRVRGWKYAMSKI